MHGTNGLVMGGSKVMFRKVFDTFGLTFAPIDIELTLAPAIADPIKCKSKDPFDCLCLMV